VFVKTRNTITIDTRACIAVPDDYPNLAQAESHVKAEDDEDVVMDAGAPSAASRINHNEFSHLPALQLQIIRRAYDSMEHVLAGFDIPACCVAYNGKQVFALKCARRALTTGVNLALNSKRSPSYEARLVKYAARGFAVEVADLDHKRVALDLDSQGRALLLDLSVHLLWVSAEIYDRTAGEGAFIRRSRGLLRLVLFDLLLKRRVKFSLKCETFQYLFARS